MKESLRKFKEQVEETMKQERCTYQRAYEITQRRQPVLFANMREDCKPQAQRDREQRLQGRSEFGNTRASVPATAPVKKSLQEFTAKVNETARRLGCSPQKAYELVAQREPALFANMREECKPKAQRDRDRGTQRRVEFANAGREFCNEFYSVIPPQLRASVQLTADMSEEQLASRFRDSAKRMSPKDALILFNALVDVIAGKDGLQRDAAIQRAKARYPEIYAMAQKP